jgi:hypothetical protein
MSGAAYTRTGVLSICILTLHSFSAQPATGSELNIRAIEPYRTPLQNSGFGWIQGKCGGSCASLNYSGPSCLPNARPVAAPDYGCTCRLSRSCRLR